jgi:hypothetical protein
MRNINFLIKIDAILKRYIELRRDMSMSSGYSSRWVVLVEGRVYLSIGTGHFTVDSMREFDQQVINALEASDAPMVHLITDSRQVLSLPPLTEIMKNRYPQHPRIGYLITVGAFQNPVMRFLFSLSSTISNVRYKDVATLAEACAFVAHKDPSLPPVSTWAIPPESDLEAS